VHLVDSPLICADCAIGRLGQEHRPPGFLSHEYHQGEHDNAPRSEVIHDLRWSALQMAQLEGRCHRDGRFAEVYWTYADATIEDKIARVVAGRIQSMKEMIGDDVETLRETERLLLA